jgi:hypothetical protein
MKRIEVLNLFNNLSIMTAKYKTEKFCTDFVWKIMLNKNKLQLLVQTITDMKPDADPKKLSIFNAYEAERKVLLTKYASKDNNKNPVIIKNDNGSEVVLLQNPEAFQREEEIIKDKLGRESIEYIEGVLKDWDGVLNADVDTSELSLKKLQRADLPTQISFEDIENLKDIIDFSDGTILNNEVS